MAAAAGKGGGDDRFEEMAERVMDSSSGSRGKRGGGGRGGRRGGGRGGGGSSAQDRDFVLSKALSTLLRHQAQNAGIKLDAEGFAPLDKVLQWPRIRSLNPTVAEIKAAVSDSAKQRFALKPNPEVVADDDDNDNPASWLIRANQGHSIALASEGLHTPITLEAQNIPAIVVHGTYFAFWDAILAAGGLRRMGRTHVHFGTGLLPSDASGSSSSKTTAGEGLASEEQKREQEREQREADEEEEEAKKIAAAAAAATGAAPGSKPQVISGMRSDAELLVFVDVEQSLRDGGEDGMKWWISANGVVLTEGDADGVVPLRYFKEVRGRRQGVGVLWRDGEKVADLPDGVVKRVPMGKTGGGERSGGGGKGRGGKGQRQGRGGR
ncbi:tRNA 2'-phosphotransferase [Diatrype stigma]|uniref:2'-phosphotransferase n=1 Tax=Diatrype stigma TaxID=117547 RepID=A0AAN9UK15_9PEZI